VQPHFRARNALRGLNIIPREYVTRVNLRPRTPSRSAGMGGWGMRGDIFRLKCSYAGKSAEPAENSRSLAPASPSFFLFSPHVAAISLFRLSTLFPVQRRVPLATPTSPSTPLPLLRLRLCLRFSLDVSRIVPATTPEQNDPPAASLDERAPPSRQPSASCTGTVPDIRDYLRWTGYNRLANVGLLFGINVNRFPRRGFMRRVARLGPQFAVRVPHRRGGKLLSFIRRESARQSSRRGEAARSPISSGD
jgi:hypothetical protein